MQDSKKEIDNPCGDCHYCCEVLTFVSRGVPPSAAREFYKARGCQLHYTKDATFISIDYPCPHLDKEKGCLLEDNKPESCRNFDGRNNPVTKDVCRLK
jgi:Fe-S-cluster containining protein